MSRERYDTFEIAREILDFECDEFIDFINSCGTLDDEYALGYLLSETIHDDYLSDDGKKILTHIGLYALDDAVNDLEQKYRYTNIPLPDGSRLSVGEIIRNWWHELWGSVNYG